MLYVDVKEVVIAMFKAATVMGSNPREHTLTTFTLCKQVVLDTSACKNTFTQM